MDDVRGRTVVEVMLEENLVLLNSGCPTHVSDATGQASYLDLSFCSPDMASLFEWSTADDLHNSDHYPIFLKSSVDLELGRLRKWKLYSADWVKFKNSVHFPETFTSVDEACHEVTSCLVNAAEASIPQSSPLVHAKYHNPWYNEDISKACKARKRALRSLRKHINADALTEYKDAVQCVVRL